LVGKFLLGMISGGLVVTGGLVVGSVLFPTRPANDNLAASAEAEAPITAPDATTAEAGSAAIPNAPDEDALPQTDPTDAGVAATAPVAEPVTEDLASAASDPAAKPDLGAAETTPEAPVADVLAVEPAAPIPAEVAQPTPPAEPVKPSDPVPDVAAAEPEAPTAAPADPASELLLAEAAPDTVTAELAPVAEPAPETVPETVLAEATAPEPTAVAEPAPIADEPAAEPAPAAQPEPAVAVPAEAEPSPEVEPTADEPAVAAEAEADAPAGEALPVEAQTPDPVDAPDLAEAPDAATPDPAEVPAAEAPALSDPAVTDPAMPGTRPAVLPGVAEADPAPAEEARNSTFKPAPSLPRAGEGVIVGRDTGTEVAEPADPAATDPAAADPAAAPVDPRPIAQFAAAFENPEAKPTLAIVLIDDGRAELDRAGLAALPFPVTFALDPLDPASAERAAIYRGAGKEVIMLVTGIAEGAMASDVEVAFQSMEQGLPEAVAVMDLPEPSFQNRRPLAATVVPILKEQGRGLLTWDAGLNAADQVARREDLAAAVIFRDLGSAGADAAAVRRLLDRAVFKAGQEGRASVVGKADPATVAALLEWTVEGKSATVALAPVTAVLTVE
jgi:polysaccharide deacetylase 2 family uncharacterized protein YibQ